MGKKVMTTRLAVAAVVLIFGLLLAGQDTAEAAADSYAPTTEAAPATATATATEAAPATATATATESAPATDATAEATPTTTPSDGDKGASLCEIPGTCNVKLAASEEANPYTRGCSKILGCRG